MDLSKTTKAYFSGIGGIGVSALAKYFISHGIEVVGSDAVHSEITDDLEQKGVKIFFEQKAENITADCRLFVYSDAVPVTNPERVRAKELGIEQKSYFESLGEISKEYKTVAVSGTNGKSSTTAMLASILIDAGKDPTAIVGSCCERFDCNFRNGKSDLFVVEACEYRGHMLVLQPKTIVLTNIEEDHLDFYRDINHIIQTFQQYVNGLKSPDDLLVINNDDINSRKVTLPDCKVVTYGLIQGADVRADNIRKEAGKQIFNVYYNNQDIGEFELPIPGNFNIYNALAAIACSLNMNVPVGIVRNTLKEYYGIWRRFEIVKNDEITVVSDYAHHPTAVASTLSAAKEFFPGRRIVAVFEPHQRDRTRKLFNEFAESFKSADVVVLSEIYEVKGRNDAEAPISSKDLMNAIMKTTPNLAGQIYFEENIDATLEKTNSIISAQDVVVVMGAGDIYKIAKKIDLK
jgi:UDP-N-acetylmuramate--alanine ligase